VRIEKSSTVSPIWLCTGVFKVAVRQPWTCSTTS